MSKNIFFESEGPFKLSVLFPNIIKKDFFSDVIL